MTRKRYNKQQIAKFLEQSFDLEAQGLSGYEIAQKLGVKRSALARWKRFFGADDATRKQNKKDSEIRRLKKENELLKDIVQSQTVELHMAKKRPPVEYRIQVDKPNA